MIPFRKISGLALRLIAAIIMVQTLWLKFSASPESVYIFSAIGIEPWGRIATGIAELVLSVTLFIPGIRVYAAMGTVGVMAGAILSHFLFIGIEVMNDGACLFFLASVTFVSALILSVLYRKEFFSHLPKKNHT